MKYGFKKRFLSLMLCGSMLIPMLTQALPVFSIEATEEDEPTVEANDEIKPLAALTSPFTPETKFELPDGTLTTSQSYRIPSMVTLADGTIVAAADIRWNTTYDGGGLDTLVAHSKDGGATWEYTLANYLDDNATGENRNVYNGSHTTFIDPSLLVAEDGKTVYMLVDLYAYGVALNGNKETSPKADTGFNTNDYLKLSNNNHTSYNYYLKDGKIYSTDGAVQTGYTVDEYFNITYKVNGVEKKSNLFYSDSPFKVARTGYLYLTKSTDGGATWSAPTLLNLHSSSEQVCLVGPGNGITTKNGTMVFPVYSYNGDAETQKMGCVYSTDGGKTWKRSANFTGSSSFSSESAVIELGDGKLRFFYRSDNAVLSYADLNLTTGTWSAEGYPVDANGKKIPVNSDTQLSAITYSRTMDGKQVVLISCPTGPNEAGSNDNNGSSRTNGKIHVFVVDAENNYTMTLKNAIKLFEKAATSKLPQKNGQDFFTESQGFFAYSALTERADGTIALLYENNQYGWGASSDNTTYYTITAKAFDISDFDVQTDLTINTKVILKSDVTQVTIYRDVAANESVTLNAEQLDGVYKVSGYYYDETDKVLYYQLACCEHISWVEDYDDYRYVRADVLEVTDQGIAYPIVDYTNAAPILTHEHTLQPVSYDLRSIRSYGTLNFMNTRATSDSSGGIVLNKTATDNGDGTYTINLEAYTTGTVTVEKKSVPMDIVLVLDQSGSMAYCIGCGKNNTTTHTVTTYTAATNVSNNGGTYYIKNGSNYSQLYHCNTCDGWLTTSQSHSGWFGSGNNHQNQTIYYPNKDTFYTATSKTEACEKRLSALKAAVTTFVNEVYEKAAGPNGVHGDNDDVAHRIAIVGFASDSGNGNNTELLSIAGSNSGSVGVRYNNISTQNYKDVLQDLAGTDANGQPNATKAETAKQMLDKAIAALASEGATRADLGMTMAENIFKNNTVDLSERNRVTIMFTDGSPTSSNSFDTTVANSAIATSNTIKNTYKSTVYTVGVFDGADASNPSSLPATGSSPNQENRFMHLVSSNYPNAKALTNTGSIQNPLVGSYYMSASSTSALNDIFQAMSESVSSETVELGSKTEVRDIVSPYFTLPDRATKDDITVTTQDAQYNNGNLSWKTSTIKNFNPEITVDTKTNTVSVEGFDFKHNFVSENGRKEGDENAQGDFHGRKLIISFKIEPNPYFLGGSGVETNNNAQLSTNGISGVYDANDTLVGEFPIPTGNVPLKPISTIVQNKHIYLGNTVDLTEILNLYVKRNDLAEDLKVTVDGVNNAYVDLEYTIKLNDNTVAVYSIPAGKKWDEGTWKTNKGELLQNYSTAVDATFTVTCVMTDKADANNKQNASGTASVFVYKPVITFKDSVQEFNKALTPVTSDIISFLNGHRVNVVWKHSTQTETPEGNMPSLTYEYSYANGAFDGLNMNSTTDVPVTVTVTIEGTGTALTVSRADSDKITFVHENCTHSGCKFNSANEEFVVHVINALTSLTIKKATTNKDGYFSFANIDPNQSFMFSVVGETDGVDLKVTVHGDGSITIDGLMVGKTYTVTELIEWSWRYQFVSWSVSNSITTSDDMNANGATITLGVSDNEITFTNKRVEDKWLDGDSWCNNIFK